MQVAVFSQYLKNGDAPYIQTLFDVLADRGIEVQVYAPYFEAFKGQITFKTKPGTFENHADFKAQKFDFVITLGGDGTILAASTLVRDSLVPILGINLGRLGFLATIGKSRIAGAIDLLVKGQYSIGGRSTLFLESSPKLFGETPFALNDFTLLKRDASSMITIHTFVNGSYLNTYWADGLILATPTGSTGYSLSCGGPIVFPDSHTFVLAPVAPHNLNVRPIVVPDSSAITLKMEGRSQQFLISLDSRSETVDDTVELTITRNSFEINLLRLEDYDYSATIRSKLNWGLDQRN